MQPLRDHAEFRVRHRHPRPISRAFEAVCFGFDKQDVLHRCRWCAAVAIHLVQVVRLAAHLAAHPAAPVNAPSRRDLRRRIQPGAAGGGVQRIPRLLLQFAGDYGGELPADPRRSLLEALSLMDALADLRLAVVEASGFTVLLGPHLEYSVRAEVPADMSRACPPGTPLLLDLRTERFLSLSPLCAWEKARGEAVGRFFMLHGVDGEVGHYVEDGTPGSPGCTIPLGGWPVEGPLELPAHTMAAFAAPPSRLSEGPDVEGEYHIHGLIWRGGTSDVFVAQRLRDQAWIALKTFEYEPGVLDENFHRFRDEERLSADIHHPRVVRPVSVSLGRHVLAHKQPFLGGGSLQDLMDTNGVLPAQRAVEVAVEVLEALQAVHAAGVIHNDVKPDNILFDDNGGAHLIDFGIACRREPEPWRLRPGSPPGTLGYVAPEVHRGDWPVPPSDIFSLGVVLVEMLTGTRPPDGRAAAELRGVPRPLKPFVARCLAVRSADRFSSAGEALAALEGCSRRLGRYRFVTLDLEGTLLNSYQERQPRPGLRRFLFFCMDSFDRIFVYTLLTAEEAEEVLFHLARQYRVPFAFLHRYEYVEWPRGEDGSTKDLRRCGVPVVDNVILDDTEEVIPADQRHRWLSVPNFHDYERLDRALLRAADQLRRMFDLP